MPIDDSRHPPSSIDPAERSFQKDQDLQDMYALALFAKLSKRKPDLKQKVAADKRMAKEMCEFTERLYSPTEPNREISQSEKLPLDPVLDRKRTSDGVFLSMLSDKGKVLWE